MKTHKSASGGQFEDAIRKKETPIFVYIAQISPLLLEIHPAALQNGGIIGYNEQVKRRLSYGTL